MKYQPPLFALQLPTSEQLCGYHLLREALESDPDKVSPGLQHAFCDLVLDADPDGLKARDINLVEKIAPLRWKSYCEGHWGPAEGRAGGRRTAPEAGRRMDPG